MNRWFFNETEQTAFDAYSIDTETVGKLKRVIYADDMMITRWVPLFPDRIHSSGDCNPKKPHWEPNTRPTRAHTQKYIFKPNRVSHASDGLVLGNFRAEATEMTF